MAVAIPYYVIVQALGLIDTRISLVLVDCALTLPFTIWFLSLYINNVPRDMEEAATVDGCTTMQALAAHCRAHDAAGPRRDGGLRIHDLVQ